MPVVSGAHGQLGLQTHHDALAVGVLRTDQGPGLDPVEHQMGFRVDQRVVDPVGHLLGPTQPVVIPGKEDSGRAVGRSIEELILFAPGDSAAALGRPGVGERSGQRRQRLRVRNTGKTIRPLQGQRHPRHIVVVVVGPAPVVAREVAADLPPDRFDPLGSRVAHLGVDQGVQQVGLPPVVPGSEGQIFAGRRPPDHAELGRGQLPEPSKVPLRDGGLGAGRPVRPLLIHDGNPALPGVGKVGPLPDPGVHGNTGGGAGIDAAG